ncbi:hypothetical protein [Phaeacidiphilus oryzae]|uniref:hypothetical protein n=1 Tax=Phaeacidiphilus oryzae TaxID=348818 RepID=UPI00056B8F15|nr:hypothetical protein [Phaeacidiphilus oryzae]
MATDQQSAPFAPPIAALLRRPAPTARAELHIVLERLVAAADAGRPLDAFLNAAGAAQIVADRLQGADGEIRRIHRAVLAGTGATGAPLSAPRGIALRALDAVAAGSAAAKGRLGLAEWHVTLRDLANVLAEAVLRDYQPEADGPDARGVLLSVATAVDGLRSGIPPQAARLLAGSTLRPPSSFRDLDLHPMDVLSLAERFADQYPDRERPLLVLGLRSSGAYLAPLAAAALSQLEYRHVVARTTCAGGPILPEEPRLPESVRRVGGLVLLIAAPPRTGGSLASVAGRLTAAGFAPERVVPMYPSLADDETPLALLRHHKPIVLPAGQWRIAELLRPPALAEALGELLPAGHTVRSVVTAGEEEAEAEADAPADGAGAAARSARGRGTGWRRSHRSVDFTAVVADPAGRERRLALRAEGAGVGYLGRRPGAGPPPRGVVHGVLISGLPEEDPEEDEKTAGSDSERSENDAIGAGPDSSPTENGGGRADGSAGGDAAGGEAAGNPSELSAESPRGLDADAGDGGGGAADGGA